MAPCFRIFEKLLPRRRIGPRARRRRRGVAFVMVLGALAILTIMLTEVQDESSAELGSALQARDALIAEYAAASAVNLSRLLIATEPTIRQALAPLFILMRGDKPQIPVWEFADQVFGAFNDEAGSQLFADFSGLDLSEGKNLGLPGASFELKIVDEDSKININGPARGDTFSNVALAAQLSTLMSGPQYDALFEERDADGNFSDRQTICAAIIDWADPNGDMELCDPMAQAEQQMPAEDSYYELLDKPYHRKNAAFDSLEELRSVRGIGDDFWATFVEPEADQPEKRTLTVWGSGGGVNVNTASPQTLWVLICRWAEGDPPLCHDPTEIQKFLTLVTLARGFTAGAPVFSSPKAFINTLKGGGMLGPLISATGLQPVELKSEAEAMKSMTVESKVFSIYAIGRVASGKRETQVQVHAVVDFRGAPAPPEALDPDAPPEATPEPQDAGGPEDLALERLLRPYPGGNVIYYRVN